MDAAERFPRLRAVAAHLEVAERSPSTNAQLRESAAALPHLAVLLTEDQTAGRGRLDRSWTAPPGSALAISVLLRRLPAAEHRGWIPLLAGVAMADAVAEQLPGREVGVKWPNDVLVEGRKICGILAEATTDGAVVLGAGVNTSMRSEQLPVPTATSFAVLGAAADLDRLAADFLAGLDRALRSLAEDGAEAARARVVAACLTIGRDVRVAMPDGSVIDGRAIGLDEDGRLRVQEGGAERTVAAGDVVHARLVAPETDAGAV